jgi:PBP1b-binding outer membrane lipoprotein LpoB
MDIILTIIASVLLLVGFLVVCRSSLDDEDEYEDEEEETPTPTHDKKSS